MNIVLTFYASCFCLQSEEGKKREKGRETIYRERNDRNREREGQGETERQRKINNVIIKDNGECKREENRGEERRRV